MTYDINFWKQEHPLSLSLQEIYERLNNREPVEGLAKLPVDDILARLKTAFPDFDPAESFPLALWSDYHFRFDIRGICGDCQKLVDIMSEFGCPMYDPQEGKRYDSQNGTALGETPKFEDATPEQKAEMERIKNEFLAKLRGQSQKKGCAGSAALFLLALGGIACAVTASHEARRPFVIRQGGKKTR